VYRTRTWMVVLLLAVTGLAAGFTRLDRVRLPPKAGPAAPRPAADTHAKDAETIRRCLNDLLRYLEEAESVSVTPMTLPPLQELPPLPSELLPEESTADLSADPA
jgi:hypothetical protein